MVLNYQLLLTSGFSGGGNKGRGSRRHHRIKVGQSSSATGGAEKGRECAMFQI